MCPFQDEIRGKSFLKKKPVTRVIPFPFYIDIRTLEYP
jgi:hypothetical protein